MPANPRESIRRAYAAFNDRDIPSVLTTLHPDVRWSKAWEGDYAIGHRDVRNYWLRQWTELDPHVEPLTITKLDDGRFEVSVSQVVKDLDGKILFEGLVKHFYTLLDGLLWQMDIGRE